MGIFDAIWRRRGRPSNIEHDDIQPKKLITMTNRDYSTFHERSNVAIKFWLPEIMDSILEQECDFAKTTRSDIIRQNLFMYLYGRHDLWGITELRNIYNFYNLNPPSGMMFSRSSPPSEDSEAPDLTKDMGKNIEDVKVWIPLKMKEDIQSLADKSDISFSEMAREIIISMLFGHTYLSARKELMQLEIQVEEEIAD